MSTTSTAPVAISSPGQDSRRQSVVSSSANSFMTAPLSQSSSSQTIGESVNPIHALAKQQASGGVHSQEMHIVKVDTDADKVFMESGPQTSLFTKVGQTLSGIVPGDDGRFRATGPPPPSPPASEHEIALSEAAGPSQPPRLSTIDSGLSTSPTEISGSPVDISPKPQFKSTKTTAHLSSDGFLQPPQPTSRPTRRNTTGSAAVGRTSLHAQFGAQPGDNADGELEADIDFHAEQIRKERQEKRAKAQQEAEDALTRSPEPEHSKPMVGNLIGEGHVNYVLMYNMLTGIRIAVSRCQAKIKRPLTPEDFTARHKYSFDIIGNELTPSAKYDFKFKDYAPSVFRELREDYFQLDPADYLVSLTAKYILSELGSPGKSGSFFYFSHDYKFIVKTIRHAEHKFLLSILPKYHEHVKNNPHTLISRFYGLHRVKLPRGRKVHFLIMNNLFPAHKDVHETFDLKGSTIGREYPEDKAATNPGAVLKDLNWINRGHALELGPEKRALLTEQLRRDAEMLREINVMDYSLLVGIHNMQRGNRENLRRNTLKVWSPDVPARMRRHATQGGKAAKPEAAGMRRAMRESGTKQLGDAGVDLPEQNTNDRSQFIFYQDEGGMQATDEEDTAMRTVYYLGVIDILTPYTVAKRAEHLWKGFSADRHKISPVPSPEYSDRFFSFMKAIMRGGEGGARFKAE